MVFTLKKSSPDKAAEEVFLALDVKKAPIADRQCQVQKCLRSLALREPTKDTEKLFKDISTHITSLLDRRDEILHGTYSPPTINPLPSAEVIFKDLLQRRKTPGEIHANGVSSLFYAFACLLDLCVRRPTTQTKQAAFDLYPLYGNEPADFDKVRNKDGRGMLSPDCFYEDRAMFLPKASSVLLILFNRNHNYLAQRLALGELSSSDPSTNASSIAEAITLEKDDRIFEAARLMNCILFRNIVMEDILKPLMGLSSVGPSHNLDLLSNNVAKTADGVNASTESTLLYDWSSIMSAEDVSHVEGIFKDVLAISSGQNTVSAFNRALQEITSTQYGDRRYRDHAGLQRGKDGRFLDADLQTILHDATESHACSAQFGVPACQRVFQVKEIERARKEPVMCSFNEYRRFLGLKPLASFEEWTSNTEVAEAAKEMYTSIDNLELYPGLECEDIVPGSGAQLGYTKTFGLLVDIVSRIRYSSLGSDLEHLRSRYGNWINDECKPGPNNGSFGASLPKLLQRTLPQGCAFNSIYVLFPFTIPNHVKTLLNDKKSDYEIIRPKTCTVHRLTTTTAIRHVFNQPNMFPTTYDPILKALTGGYGYMLGFDDEDRHDADLKMSLHALLPDATALKRYAQSFSRMTRDCVRKATVKADNGTHEIDVGRDIINAVCTRWVCETLIDFPFQNKKSNDHSLWDKVQETVSKWVYPLLKPLRLVTMEQSGPEKSGPEKTEAEMQAAFAAIYAYIFHNAEPESEWQLRIQALKMSEGLRTHIRRKLPPPTALSKKFPLMSAFDSIVAFATLVMREYKGINVPGQTAQTFLDRVVNTNKTVPPPDIDPHEDRVIANVMGLTIVAAVKYAKVCTQAVEFYLQDDYAKEREAIIKLSNSDDPKSQKLLMGYIREAYRFNHPLGIWRGVSDAASGKSIPQGTNAPDIKVEAGDMIFADFSAAFTANDPSDPSLKNPLKVDPERNVKGLLGFGLHKCPGMTFADSTMPQIFKEIFRLKNIRRAPGLRGKLVQFHPFPESNTSTGARSLVDVNGNLVIIPTSLVVRHDYQEDAPTNNINRKSPVITTPKWSVPNRTSTEKIRWITNAVMSVIVILLVLWNIFRIIIYVMSFFGRLSSPVPVEQPAPSQMHVVCPLPKSSIHPWEIVSMKAGADGKLIPIEYTLDLPTAHTLSIVDIDAKDMVMSFWLDNKSLGSSYNVELNKSDNCGEDPNECLRRGFSGGYLEFPKGKHTVRIQWDGVEKPGPDGRIDWGEEGGRRVAWSRDACAA